MRSALGSCGRSGDAVWLAQPGNFPAPRFMMRRHPESPRPGGTVAGSAHSFAQGAMAVSNLPGPAVFRQTDPKSRLSRRWHDRMTERLPRTVERHPRRVRDPSAGDGRLIRIVCQWFATRSTGNDIVRRQVCAACCPEAAFRGDPGRTRTLNLLTGSSVQARSRVCGQGERDTAGSPDGPFVCRAARIPALRGRSRFHCPTRQHGCGSQRADCMVADWRGRARSWDRIHAVTV